MTSVSVTRNKAKIAGRVIEVLDYFNDKHREATVMDIVRHYDRPQSSTSELLHSLVELGLLRKNPNSRAFSLTARAAMLGMAGQDTIVRDGSLTRLLDRLVAQTGLSVALFGMVSLRCQVISWHPGTRCHAGAVRGLHAGMQERLSDSASGWLLLSTVGQQRWEGIIRRLNAEAAENQKFLASELASQLHQCSDSGFVHGPAGFGVQGHIMAALLPPETCQHAMAAGFVYGAKDGVNPSNLRDCLMEAVSHVAAPTESRPARIESIYNAA